MSKLWERLTKPKPADEALIPSATDEKGAALYADFEECISKNKFRVFGAVWLVTLPWSFVKKTPGPFILGTIMALLPEIMYANWRCDAEYTAFAAHARAHVAAAQQARASAGTGHSSINESNDGDRAESKGDKRTWWWGLPGSTIEVRKAGEQGGAGGRGKS